MSYIGNVSFSSVATGPISTRGRHLLLELHGCKRDALVDSVALERVLRRAAELANVQVMCVCFHQFPAGGVTGVLVLAESHISIHTWPEHQYAAVDFFTCGEGKPENGIDCLRAGLGAVEIQSLVVVRGSSSEFGQ